MQFKWCLPPSCEHSTHLSVKLHGPTIFNRRRENFCNESEWSCNCNKLGRISDHKRGLKITKISRPRLYNKVYLAFLQPLSSHNFAKNVALLKAYIQNSMHNVFILEHCLPVARVVLGYGLAAAVKLVDWSHGRAMRIRISSTTF